MVFLHIMQKHLYLIKNGNMEKKNLVFLTGSGISAESGIPTFRMAADSLWENHDVDVVCTINGWMANSNYVNNFYNMLRVKYKDILPNDAHKLIAELENDYNVTVVTQNVDNLHEKAGSSNVLHLHGDLLKCCSEENKENPAYWVTLPKEGFGESGYEIPENYKAGDGSLLRPYIVFFGEDVPNMQQAIDIVRSADILVVVGTSLQVYPAAGLVDHFDIMKPLYIIDPDKDLVEKLLLKGPETHHICKGASDGMKTLIDSLQCK